MAIENVTPPRSTDLPLEAPLTGQATRMLNYSAPYSFAGAGYQLLPDQAMGQIYMPGPNATLFGPNPFGLVPQGRGYFGGAYNAVQGDPRVAQYGFPYAQNPFPGYGGFGQGTPTGGAGGQQGGQGQGNQGGGQQGGQGQANQGGGQQPQPNQNPFRDRQAPGGGYGPNPFYAGGGGRNVFGWPSENAPNPGQQYWTQPGYQYKIVPQLNQPQQNVRPISSTQQFGELGPYLPISAGQNPFSYPFYQFSQAPQQQQAAPIQNPFYTPGKGYSEGYFNYYGR